MKTVILAGGLGKRLRPFTESIPKPMLPIGEKSVLEIQIDRLSKAGCEEIILATNYKSEIFKSYFKNKDYEGTKIIISKEKKRLGTVGPISILKERLDEPFIVMNGDILTLIDFQKFYKFALKNEAILTLAIKKEITPFAFGNIFFKGDYVTGIEEKPDFISYILAGIYVMKPDIFSYIPQNEYYDMDKLILNLLNEKLQVAKYDLFEYWLDIGRPDDYEKAKKVFNKNFKNIKKDKDK